MKKIVLAAMIAATVMSSGVALVAGPALAAPKVGTCSGGDRYGKDGLWHADKTCPTIMARPGSPASAFISAPTAGDGAVALAAHQPGCILRPASPVPQSCGGPAGAE